MGGLHTEPRFSQFPFVVHTPPPLPALMLLPQEVSLAYETKILLGWAWQNIARGAPSNSRAHALIEELTALDMLGPDKHHQRSTGVMQVGACGPALHTSHIHRPTTSAVFQIIGKGRGKGSRCNRPGIYTHHPPPLPMQIFRLFSSAIMRYPSTASPPGRKRSYRPGLTSTGHLFGHSSATEGTAALSTSQVRLSSMRSLASMRFPLRSGLQGVRGRTERGASFVSPQDSALPDVSITTLPGTTPGGYHTAAGSSRPVTMPPLATTRLDSATMAARSGGASPCPSSPLATATWPTAPPWTEAAHPRMQPQHSETSSTARMPSEPLPLAGTSRPASAVDATDPDKLLLLLKTSLSHPRPVRNNAVGDEGTLISRWRRRSTHLDQLSASEVVRLLQDAIAPPRPPALMSRRRSSALQPEQWARPSSSSASMRRREAGGGGGSESGSRSGSVTAAGAPWRSVGSRALLSGEYITSEASQPSAALWRSAGSRARLGSPPSASDSRQAGGLAEAAVSDPPPSDATTLRRLHSQARQVSFRSEDLVAAYASEGGPGSVLRVRVRLVPSPGPDEGAEDHTVIPGGRPPRILSRMAGEGPLSGGSGRSQVASPTGALPRHDDLQGAGSRWPGIMAPSSLLLLPGQASAAPSSLLLLPRQASAAPTGNMQMSEASQVQQQQQSLMNAERADGADGRRQGSRNAQPQGSRNASLDEGRGSRRGLGLSCLPVRLPSSRQVGSSRGRGVSLLGGGAAANQVITAAGQPADTFGSVRSAASVVLTNNTNNELLQEDNATDGVSSIPGFPGGLFPTARMLNGRSLGTNPHSSGLDQCNEAVRLRLRSSDTELLPCPPLPDDPTPSGGGRAAATTAVLMHVQGAERMLKEVKVGCCPGNTGRDYDVRTQTVELYGERF